MSLLSTTSKPRLLKDKRNLPWALDSGREKTKGRAGDGCLVP